MKITVIDEITSKCLKLEAENEKEQKDLMVIVKDSDLPDNRIYVERDEKPKYIKIVL